MPVASPQEAPWLLLIFSLPAKAGSRRVDIWRKLQRYGTIALPSSGHVLPNTPTNQERMEWLATAIRNYNGQASVVQVQNFDDLPADRLKSMFQQARSSDYERLQRELKKFLSLRRAARPLGSLTRLRQKLQAIASIDFFDSPIRGRIEKMIERAEDDGDAKGHNRSGKAGDYLSRIWMTRPRPGIDRVSSAWLIQRFIDPKARFIFSHDPAANPDAIPFDMFCPQGFGHRGDACTFETLRNIFKIQDARVKRISEIVHDADLNDGKFGRTEGEGLDRVLNGWAKQDLSDDELLRRGGELIEALYQVI
jgi:hypothetical protein